MPFFSHDSQHFHYLDQGAGTPFIFQHGLGANVHQPDDLFSPRAGFRFISMDCRNHGDTRPLSDPDKLNFDTFADDLRSLLTYLGVTRAIVGGISLGAGVALNFTLRYPEQVLGLVLSRPAWLDSPAPENSRGIPAAAAYIRQYGARVGLENFKQSEVYRAVEQQSPDSAVSLASQFADPRADEAVDRLERLPADAPNRDAAEWATIRVPTLVLGTRRDLIHPYAYAETLAGAIPGAALQELTPKSVSPERYRLDTQNAIDNFLQQHFVH
jgi:pimeloyl-ACP methyl ester carboxylesterase